MKRNFIYNCNGKLNEIYSREKSYDLHVKKLEQIKNKKCQSPSVLPHLQLLEQRNLVKEQRRRFDQGQETDQINRVNGHLYHKITEICNRPFSHEFYTPDEDRFYHPHHLNLTHRKLMAQQIQYENSKLATRILQQEPIMRVDDLKVQYKQSKKMMIRVQKYQQSIKFVQQQIRNKQGYILKSTRDASTTKSQSVKIRQPIAQKCTTLNQSSEDVKLRNSIVGSKGLSLSVDKQQEQVDDMVNDAINSSRQMQEIQKSDHFSQGEMDE